MRKLFLSIGFLCFGCAALGAAGSTGRVDIDSDEVCVGSDQRSELKVLSKPKRLQDEYGHVRTVDAREVSFRLARARAGWEAELAHRKAELPNIHNVQEYERCASKVLLLQELLDTHRQNTALIERVQQSSSELLRDALTRREK